MALLWLLYCSWPLSLTSLLLVAPWVSDMAPKGATWLKSNFFWYRKVKTDLSESIWTVSFSIWTSFCSFDICCSCDEHFLLFSYLSFNKASFSLRTSSNSSLQKYLKNFKRLKYFCTFALSFEIINIQKYYVFFNFFF